MPSGSLFQVAIHPNHIGETCVELPDNRNHKSSNGCDVFPGLQIDKFCCNNQFIKECNQVLECC